MFTAMTRYRRRAQDVDVTPLANGNFLVSDGDGRREVWYPEAFAAAFEPLQAYTCPDCGEEMVYDTDEQALVCVRRCLGV